MVHWLSVLLYFLHLHVIVINGQSQSPCHFPAVTSHCLLTLLFSSLVTGQWWALCFYLLSWETTLNCTDLAFPTLFRIRSCSLTPMKTHGKWYSVMSETAQGTKVLIRRILGGNYVDPEHVMIYWMYTPARGWAVRVLKGLVIVTQFGGHHVHDRTRNLKSFFLREVIFFTLWINECVVS